MKRYMIDATGITDVSSIVTLKRNFDVANGILLNGIHTTITDWSGRDFSKYTYNDMIAYRSQALSEFPESTVANTVITCDGLIGILSNQKLNVIDIFEDYTGTYDAIRPEDYQDLINAETGLNPLNKRVFIVNSDVSGNVETKNEKLYTSGTDVYFESLMDYELNAGLEKDPYMSTYISKNTWSTYENVSDFIFYKRQLFIIESNLPGFTITSINSLVENIDYFITGNKVFIKRPALTSGNTRFTFTFTANVSEYGYVKIY